MFLITHSSNETVLFAMEELKNGLQKAGILDISSLPSTAYTGETPSIHLGLPNHLPKAGLIPSKEDSFAINIKDSDGYLCGSNPRSLLFAVYDLLRFIGFEWVNPKSESFEAKGDFKKNGLTYQTIKKASTFHRGIVLEGSTSLENTLDMIHWLPKLYFNSYFIQFKLPYHFFMNWYRHTENSLLEPEPFSEKRAEQLKAAVELALKKRDLLYHAVGHAWTCESIGVKGLTWDQSEVILSEMQKSYTALVNGKRGLFGNITLNTNLCYENLSATNLFIKEVVNYAKENPDIHYLHIWLADGLNNFCECELCKDKLPSDQYLRLLNRIDEALTRENIDMKLVFLIYFDLLYAPQVEHLKNPDRFVLMFAPITRSFEVSYSERGSLPTPLSYVKNRIHVPRSIEENLSFLKAWQEQVSTDSFVFDYPLGRAHYGDPGYYKISEILFKDIRCLKELGLNGYISCQEQRSFFPNALPNFTMGFALFDDKISFEEISTYYFEKTYGKRGKEVLHLLKKLSSLFHIDYWNTLLPKENLELAKALEDISTIVEHLATLIQETKKEFEAKEDIYHFNQWDLLSHLIPHILYFSKALSARAEGDEAKMKENFRLLSDYLQKNELNIQPYLDVFRFLNLSKHNIKLGGEEV